MRRSVQPTSTPGRRSPAAHAAATQAPTATAGPTLAPVPGDPRNRLGSATSTDAMNDATSWIWPTGLNDFTSMSYSGGLMTLTGLTEKLGWRLANPEGTDFGNLYLEATFKTGTCSGSDQYGMIVRVPVLKDADRATCLASAVTASIRCASGTAPSGTKGTMTRLKDWTASDAIVKGSNQINRMGLMMVGSRLIMYANGHLLGEVSDSTWTSGYFRYLCWLRDRPRQFAVQVDEMSYWKNPTP